MSSKPIHQLDGATTPEEIYRTRFEWLMRWAMYFCGNDRQMAEDLVQDTFTQMLTSWEQIRNLDQPEQFLYSCLRYGFLRQRRLGRRLLTEGLTAVDYDSMMVSARQVRGHEGEWQNDLRAIVAFLCWRKESVRSASLLLFRFFHGFFPAEIASIAILPRSAIYDAIDYSRQETKTYLKDPRKLLEMRRGAPPLPHAKALLPPEQFVEELSATIFASCHSPCKPAATLMDRYEQGSGVPIDHHLLAHLASCRVCLDLAISRFGLPPRGSRSLDHSLAPAPRTRSAVPRVSPSGAAQSRSLNMARLRCEEARCHRPHEIVLFVNGRAVAARDVNSKISELSVDLADGTVPEFIEVVSEQGLILFSTLVANGCRAICGEQVFHRELIDGRTLMVGVETSVGPQVRVRYVDPLYEATVRHLDVAMIARPAPHLFPLRKTASGDISRHSVFVTRWNAWLTNWSASKRSLIAAGCTALLLFAITSAARHKTVSPAIAPVPTVQAVLDRAIAVPHGTGVEQQNVRIQAAGGTVIVSLHRDLTGRRSPSKAAVTPITPSLHQRLASAGILWSNPLSAASFRDWHAQQVNPADVVRKEEGLIQVTTSVTHGAVRVSSLTVREADWHPVARSAYLADGELVEIAEVDYAVIPWQHDSSRWFEPETSSYLRLPAIPEKIRFATQPSPAELDDSELRARLALATEGVDASERISLSRSSNSVVVSGLVATNDRREQITQLLAGVSHINMRISTFSQVESATAELPRVSSGITMAVGSGTSSPFDRWLLEQRYSPSDVTRLHTALFHSATTMRRNEIALAQIEQSFDLTSLSESGRAHYSALRHLYLSRITEASVEQADLLQEMHVAAGTNTAGSGDLIAQVDQNAAICLQLLSGNPGDHEDPPVLMQKLAEVRADLASQLVQPGVDRHVSSAALAGDKAAR